MVYFATLRNLHQHQARSRHLPGNSFTLPANLSIQSTANHRLNLRRALKVNLIPQSPTAHHFNQLQAGRPVSNRVRWQLTLPKHLNTVSRLLTTEPMRWPMRQSKLLTNDGNGELSTLPTHRADLRTTGRVRSPARVSPTHASPELSTNHGYVKTRL